MKLIVEIELKGESNYRCSLSSMLVPQQAMQINGIDGERLICENIPSYLQKTKTLLEIADKVKEDVIAYVDGVNSSSKQISSV